MEETEEEREADFEALIRGEDVQESTMYEFEVLPDSWQYLRVYQTCQPTFIENVCLGISATEIASACENQSITGKKRTKIAAGLHVMSRAMAEYHNRKGR